MAWRWYCTWHNDAGSWEDYASCRGHCKVLYKTEKKARTAAKQHQHYGVFWGRRGNYDNPVHVVEVDGRRWKGWKIV